MRLSTTMRIIPNLPKGMPAAGATAKGLPVTKIDNDAMQLVGLKTRFVLRSILLKPRSSSRQASKRFSGGRDITAIRDKESLIRSNSLSVSKGGCPNISA